MSKTPVSQTHGSGKAFPWLGSEELKEKKKPFSGLHTMFWSACNVDSVQLCSLPITEQCVQELGAAASPSWSVFILDDCRLRLLPSKLSCKMNSSSMGGRSWGPGCCAAGAPSAQAQPTRPQLFCCISAVSSFPHHHSQVSRDNKGYDTDTHVNTCY